MSLLGVLNGASLDDGASRRLHLTGMCGQLPGEMLRHGGARLALQVRRFRFELRLCGDNAAARLVGGLFVIVAPSSVFCRRWGWAGGRGHGMESFGQALDLVGQIVGVMALEAVGPRLGRHDWADGCDGGDGMVMVQIDGGRRGVR